MAVGVLDAAHELGLSLPDDLSVVGFDNTIITTHVNPTLTTVARPYQDMGVTTVQLLVKTITAAPEERQVKQIDLPTELLIRQSTAPPRSTTHLEE
jgi:LacI family transcriptional regulator